MVFMLVAYAVAEEDLDPTEGKPVKLVFGMG